MYRFGLETAMYKWTGFFLETVMYKCTGLVWRLLCINVQVWFGDGYV